MIGHVQRCHGHDRHHGELRTNHRHQRPHHNRRPQGGKRSPPPLRRSSGPQGSGGNKSKASHHDCDQHRPGKLSKPERGSKPSPRRQKRRPDNGPHGAGPNNQGKRKPLAVRRNRLSGKVTRKLRRPVSQPQQEHSHKKEDHGGTDRCGKGNSGPTNGGSVKPPQHIPTAVPRYQLSGTERADSGAQHSSRPGHPTPARPSRMIRDQGGRGAGPRHCCVHSRHTGEQGSHTGSVGSPRSGLNPQQQA
jgi:hypothetical protein